MGLLNSLSPAAGSTHNRKRVGRGIGSGYGKTAGRGHKGLKSRSGGRVRAGFEGGQMPLVKRLPKYGFTSMISRKSAKLPLSSLTKIAGAEVNLITLKKAGLIKQTCIQAKIFLSGNLDKKLDKKIKVSGIAVSQGAKKAIEKVGGSIDQ